MMEAMRAARFQRLLKDRRLIVVLRDQFDHKLASIGERETEVRFGCRAAIATFGRHERTDQKPRADTQKLTVLAQSLLDICDRVGNLDDRIVTRPKTEYVHRPPPCAALRSRRRPNRSGGASSA
jgi:hypothetical protein